MDLAEILRFLHEMDCYDHEVFVSTGIGGNEVIRQIMRADKELMELKELEKTRERVRILSHALTVIRLEIGTDGVDRGWGDDILMYEKTLARIKEIAFMALSQAGLLTLVHNGEKEEQETGLKHKSTNWGLK